MELLNHGWQFAYNHATDFTPIQIPHDWLIYDVNNLYQSGIGWYRRVLTPSELDFTQRVFIYFDGVYMDSTLYVNDQEIGQWKYGYTAFEFEITDLLIPDSENILMLKVNYEAPNSRWYTGAGIYRDVFLIQKPLHHFKTNGINISTYQKGGHWTYMVDCEVDSSRTDYQLVHECIDKDIPFTAWSPNNPKLYTLKSSLFIDGLCIHTVNTRFGFRECSFSANDGFALNGEYIKLNGVCLHHDLGSLGAAVHKDAIIRQLLLLRDMGVNAIRTAHNPPAKVFMELADEMGFLIVSELLDMWKQPKNTYDYARFFDQWIEKDVASWIRRDRNHPSLIFWSIGNEIYDTHANADDGNNTIQKLMNLVRQYDPHEHAPITFGSNYMPWENTQKCADLIGYVGYNYAENLYADHHKAHPDWIIYGSETCSTAQSRGIYHFPLSQSILADDDLQCSALGNSSTSWGARSVEACIIADRDTPFSLGQFIWAGQDYLGEPTPYHTKNTYLGHIDTAGFPKDSYYIFQAAWTDYIINPMIHLFPYWDFSPGQQIDVRVCSNAPYVELFLNGKSHGKRCIENQYITSWSIPYESGDLYAIAYDANHNVLADIHEHSFLDAHSHKYHYDVYENLTFVTITAIDVHNVPVKNANHRVRVSVENGELLTLDNGDATDYDSYHHFSRRLFSGKLLAIVRATSDKQPRVHATMDTQDIPIRKVELLNNKNTLIAQLYPKNTTYQDLEWRLTDVSGIDSPLGDLQVSEDRLSATLIEKGNGDVYVRCSPKNGRSHVAFISQIKHTIHGKGKLHLDPYSFISGGLYSCSNVPLTNGNERGVATLRNQESHVTFENLDFGPYGSNHITLPLFPLEKEPFTFEIWEGIPNDKGQHIMTCEYNLGSIWNTYQEVTYQLPKQLTHLTSVTFVFRQKVHIKGFSFKKLEKAYAKLYAAECDRVYGDSYTLQSKAIENIGNNVSLVYKDMNFGLSGAQNISLKWRSDRSKNSIQLVTTDSVTGSMNKQMLELPQASDYSTVTLPLEKSMTGHQTVTLIFLPGSQLDLKWIQFKEDSE